MLPPLLQLSEKMQRIEKQQTTFRETAFYFRKKKSLYDTQIKMLIQPSYTLPLALELDLKVLSKVHWTEKWSILKFSCTDNDMHLKTR